MNAVRSTERATMKSVKIFAAVAFMFLVVAAMPLSAQERNIKISVFVSHAEMQGETDFGDGFVTDFDDGKGFGAAASLPLGRIFAVEGAVFNIHTDAGLILDDVAAFDLGKMSLTPVSLGGQLHVLGQSRFDPYVGAGVAYIPGDDLTSADLTAAGLGAIELESAVGYYINAGLAFQITEGFGIVVDARQLQYEPSSRSSVTGVEQDLEITPRILSAGLRLRF